MLAPLVDPRAALPRGVRLPSRRVVDTSEVPSAIGVGGGGPAGLEIALVEGASSCEEVNPEIPELDSSAPAGMRGKDFALALVLLEELDFGVRLGSVLRGMTEQPCQG